PFFGEAQVTRVVTSPYVFTRLETMDRMRMPRESIERAMTKAKLEWVGFHDFRHFRASQWVMRGVDIPTVKDYLGHADIHTTMRYAHFAPSHARTERQRSATPGTNRACRRYRGRRQQ